MQDPELRRETSSLRWKDCEEMEVGSDVKNLNGKGTKKKRKMSHKKGRMGLVLIHIAERKERNSKDSLTYTVPGVPLSSQVSPGSSQSLSLPISRQDQKSPA